jgi:hypothetical protein
MASFHWPLSSVQTSVVRRRICKLHKRQKLSPVSFGGQGILLKANVVLSPRPGTMVQQSGLSSAHRNSLGYTIRVPTDLGGGGPLIVWAKSQSGKLVFISDAERGSHQRLSCECGSLLVAKKGDVYAHHFARSWTK